jgi:glycosyltransferase involved in cell wall biosynthesis
MKLCRIVYEMPPPWDGLAPHPYEVTLAQSKRGYEQDVFCGRWPKAGKPEEIKGVKLHHILREPIAGTIGLTSSVALFFQYLKWRKHNRPDILHCHGHFALWIYRYRLFLQKHFPWSEELQIPLVAHFHNTAQGRWESFKKENKPVTPQSKYISWPLQVKSDKLAVKVASACIFVSTGTRDEAIKYYGADPRRCFVVETGVNTHLFAPAAQQEREKSRKELGLDIFDKVVLNLGMMVERKNIHLLVEAFAKLPPVYKLVLVGGWDSTYQQKVAETISRLGIEDRIIKIGYTPYPLNPIAHQISDIFVLPSTFEGTPKVVMQSLACGVPALVSGFKLQEEIAGLHYLENTEPATITQKILEIVEAQEKVDTQTIFLKYSWDEKIKEIDRVYDFAQKNHIL